VAVWCRRLRLPTLEAPAATHTGWNLRKAGFGEGELCDNTGSMLPFAKTKEERMASGDARPSLAERYPNPGDRAALIEKAAKKLMADRLLLEEDVKGFLQATN
jgi:Alpha/beta hydrolase domain